MKYKNKNKNEKKKQIAYKNQCAWPIKPLGCKPNE